MEILLHSRIHCSHIKRETLDDRSHTRIYMKMKSAKANVAKNGMETNRIREMANEFGATTTTTTMMTTAAVAAQWNEMKIWN